MLDKSASLSGGLRPFPASIEKAKALYVDVVIALATNDYILTEGDRVSGNQWFLVQNRLGTLKTAMPKVDFDIVCDIVHKYFSDGLILFPWENAEFLHKKISDIIGNEFSSRPAF